MPKRNIVWIVVGAVLAVLLWRLPESLIRRDTLYNEFSSLFDVRVQIMRNYVEKPEQDVLLRGAIDGMLSRLDPYSAYFDAKEYEQFSSVTSGQFYGIGVEVSELATGEMVVVTPIEGSPAFKAGLQSRDRILRIDGHETVEITLQQGVDLIKGPPGTTVRLTLYRPGTDEVFDRMISRGLVTVPSIRGWARDADHRWDYMIEKSLKIGYVRILNFEGTTGEQLDLAVRDLLSKQGMRALVLDVRDNPGGLLEVVVQIVDRYLSQGRIVSTKGRTMAEDVYYASPENVYPDFPLVVLVNGGSASASEILAGSLGDHDRATVVGEKTYGKGSVQEIFAIGEDQGAVKLTTGYYYLPKGERIHGKGIVPDVVVELTEAERLEVRRSQIKVYRDGIDVDTQPATSSAPSVERVEILIDRQLQAGLDELRAALGNGGR